MNGVVAPEVGRRLGWNGVARWFARVWAVGLVLFWGAFFVEHVQEWLLTPKGLPPGWVLGAMLAHFTLLVGLVLGWRWEILGGLTTLVASVLFLAGKASPSLLPIFLLANSVPALIWLVIGGYDMGRRSLQETPD